MRTVRVIFAHEGDDLIFVDAEDASGNSVRIGKWVDLPDGLGALQVRILTPISTINIVMDGDGQRMRFVHIENLDGDVIEAGEWFDSSDARELLLHVHDERRDDDCKTEIDTASSSLLLSDIPTSEDDDEEEPENFLCPHCGSTYGEPTNDGSLWRCTDCGTRERPIKQHHRPHRRGRAAATGQRFMRLCSKCGLFHWSDEACPDWPRRNDNAWYLCKFCEAYHPHTMNCIDGAHEPMKRLRLDVPTLPTDLVPEAQTTPFQYQGDPNA